MPKANGSAKTLSVRQVLKMFPDDDSVIEWLEKTRWDGKPVCAHCKSGERVSNPKSKPHTYWCGSCRKNFTVTTGTIFHATKTPLPNWIYAMYSVMTARKGVSAMQLSKELEVQYRTAWYMLHRIREACGDGDDTLAGIIEMDEVFIGGREGAKHANKKLRAGRGTVGKTPVMGARQRGGKTVAKPVENADMKTANEFAVETVSEGSTVYTDDSKIYGKLPFAHDSVNHSANEYVRGDCHTNGMESVWAVFKRSLHGTWHHVSRSHLHRYVNEATMRLNSGNVRRDTIDRMESLVRNIDDKRIRYKDLIAKNGLKQAPRLT
ncbi:MAG: IS1595 family transposase [Boseongicola sp. SB0667_bin_21]|nr:IS1595 family transposase [Boseongicola sp. SB0667_bin_21]